MSSFLGQVTSYVLGDLTEREQESIRQDAKAALKESLELIKKRNSTNPVQPDSSRTGDQGLRMS